MTEPMSDRAPSFDLRSRASYQHWVTHTLRYNDQDPIGHVNNSVFSTFLEQGRTAFLHPIVKSAAHPGLDIVLARIVIDFLKELHFPGHVEIGSRIVRLGTKSFVVANGVFDGASDTCAATGEATLVFFDTNTRRAVLPPPSVRAKFERLLGG